MGNFSVNRSPKVVFGKILENMEDAEENHAGLFREIISGICGKFIGAVC